MAYASDNPYRDFGLTAIQAPADARAGFIRQTYAHLLGAVLAFVGIERMKLFGPVKVNDTIQVDIEVLDTKAVPARGGGIVRYRQWVKNQRGETVMEYDVARLIRAGQEKQ